MSTATKKPPRKAYERPSLIKAVARGRKKDAAHKDAARKRQPSCKARWEKSSIACAGWAN